MPNDHKCNKGLVSPAASKPVSSWLNHVRETHAKSGGSMKDAMRLAKESYRAELR